MCMSAMQKTEKQNLKYTGSISHVFSHDHGLTMPMGAIPAAMASTPAELAIQYADQVWPSAQYGKA